MSVFTIRIKLYHLNFDGHLCFTTSLVLVQLYICFDVMHFATTIHAYINSETCIVEYRESPVIIL